MQVRIQKGLCFGCSEKWGKDHRRNAGQVFVIARLSDDEDGEDDNEVKSSDEGEPI